MTDAQTIIKEALTQRSDDQRRSNLSLVERIFDFTGFFGDEGRDKSSAIVYLTDRFLAEHAAREKAEKVMSQTRSIALRCVEIYGPEATEKFHDDWERMADSL